MSEFSIKGENKPSFSREPDSRWSGTAFSKGKLSGVNFCTVKDGPGFRVSLYTSGCLFQCDGCWNKQAQSFANGFPFTVELQAQVNEALAKPYIAGLSILGGEPLLNVNTVLSSALAAKQLGKSVWCWTGFKAEYLLHKDKDADRQKLLELIDVLVDGPFNERLRKLSRYTGSSNQRVLDWQATRDVGNPVLLAAQNG